MGPNLQNLNPAWPCSAFPVRQGDVLPIESSAAELWMQEAYKRAFEAQHPNARCALVLCSRPSLMDSSYFQYLLNLTDPSKALAIQVILKYLLSDFKNALAQGQKKILEQAYKNKQITPEIIQGFIDFIKRPGGLRKPDILGIDVSQDTGLLDLHEVCTVKTLGETRKELAGKLDQLKTNVIPFASREITDRQTTLNASVDPLVHALAAQASAWAPPRSLRACPLNVNFDPETDNTKITWACFEPAVDTVTQQLVEPGLLPYHIHEVSGKKFGQTDLLPTAVRKDLAAWRARLSSQMGLQPLQLLPQLNPTITAELQGLPPDVIRAIAYGSAGILLVALCVLAAPLALATVEAISGAVLETSAVTVPALWGLSKSYGDSLQAAGADLLQKLSQNIAAGQIVAPN